MTTAVDELKEIYHSALSDYLIGKGEESLERSYEFGKSIMALGMGCLDLLKIHEETMALLLINEPETSNHIDIIKLGFDFLAESLSPYEMTHRGFQEVIAELRKQTNELVEINLHLESEIKVRMETEKQLSDSEKKYRSLVETARDVIYTLSTDGIITSINPAFESLTGWRRENWIGNNFAPLVHPDDLPIALDVFAKVLQGENPPIFELRIKRRDGEFLIVEFVKTPRYYDGQIVGVLGIARDATSRKKAEQKLLENEKLLANAQQLAHIGSWEWEIASNKIHWSEELYRIYGTTPDKFEATLDAYLNHIHPDDRNIVRKNVERTLQTYESFRSEYRIVHDNGTIRTVEGRGEVILNEANKPLKLRGTCQDITERKERDEAMRSLAKRVVDAQEEERRRIARDLHDNICQQLSAIKLHISGVEEKLANKGTKSFDELQNIKKLVSRTIKDIRSLSSNLRPSTLDDLGLATALQLLCREFEEMYHIKIQFESDGVEKSTFNGHRETALYRIAQEALMNVVKHAQASKVIVRLKAEPSSAIMVVQDDGKGFEEGRQLPRSDKSGYGLMNMKERAQLLGGTFKITSALNRGTILYLNIPLN